MIMVWCIYNCRTIVLVLFGLFQADAYYEPSTLPPDLQKYFDNYRQGRDLTQVEGEVVFWDCIQQYISQLAAYAKKSNDMNDPKVKQFFIDLLRDSIRQMSHAGREKRQADRGRGRGRGGGRRRRPRRRRVRREIRQLTRRQRERFFTAVNALKRDTRILPNVYDWLAGFHSGEIIQRAHFGPAFPAWHRFYLWIFETILRQHVRGVTIPYWASHLDGGMTDPTQSLLWSPAFFGNPTGIVNEGPMRDWGQINNDTVPVRAVGQASRQLYTLEGIATIMSRTRHSEILIPTFLPGSHFEGQHGAAHVFVGGSMNDLNRAAQDVVFFCHHAYVDKLWEDFRNKIRTVDGVDPTRDYPYDPTDNRFSPLHAPNASMGFGINFRNIHGYSDAFSRIIRYAAEPTCISRDDECNSLFLWCETTRRRCVSRTRAEMPTVNYVNDTTVDTPANRTSPCPSQDIVPDLYHDYQINNVRDPKMWVYIPAKIVTRRPPEFKRFPQYSTYKTVTESQNLHFQNPVEYTLTSSPAQLDKYQECEYERRTTGKIKVVSYGLNYMGYYDDYAIIDKRVTVGMATTFVAIKKPINGTASEAIVAAFDECGRACRPFKSAGTDGSNFPGTIRVTPGVPKMYGEDYEEALSIFWDQPSESSCPRMDKGNVHLTFYCDYTDTWPWASAASNSDPPLVEGTQIKQNTEIKQYLEKNIIQEGKNAQIVDIVQPAVISQTEELHLSEVGQALDTPAQIAKGESTLKGATVLDKPFGLAAKLGTSVSDKKEIGLSSILSVSDRPEITPPVGVSAQIPGAQDAKSPQTRLGAILYDQKEVRPPPGVLAEIGATLHDKQTGLPPAVPDQIVTTVSDVKIKGLLSSESAEIKTMISNMQDIGSQSAVPALSGKIVTQQQGTPTGKIPKLGINVSDEVDIGLVQNLAQIKKFLKAQGIIPPSTAPAGKRTSVYEQERKRPQDVSVETTASKKQGIDTMGRTGISVLDNMEIGLPRVLDKQQTGSVGTWAKTDATVSAKKQSGQPPGVAQVRTIVSDENKIRPPLELPAEIGTNQLVNNVLIDNVFSNLTELLRLLGASNKPLSDVTQVLALVSHEQPIRLSPSLQVKPAGPPKYIKPMQQTTPSRLKIRKQKVVSNKNLRKGLSKSTRSVSQSTSNQTRRRQRISNLKSPTVGTRSFRTSTRRKTVSAPVRLRSSSPRTQTSRRGQERRRQRIYRCHLGTKCIIRERCSRCLPGRVYTCINNPKRYVTCPRGQFFLH